MTATDTPQEVRIEIRIEPGTPNGLVYIAAAIVGALIGFAIVVTVW